MDTSYGESIQTMTDAVCVFMNLEMHSVVDLLVQTYTNRTTEIGSASINGRFHEGFEEIRNRMKEEFSVHQKNAHLNEAFREAGDPDTHFYFGGWKEANDKKRSWVPATEYLILLSYIAENLSQEARDALNILSDALLRMSSQLGEKNTILDGEEID